jgi:hypothetical protein
MLTFLFIGLAVLSFVEALDHNSGGMICRRLF